MFGDVASDADPGVNAGVEIRRGDLRDRAFVNDLGRRIAGESVSPLRITLPALVDVAFAQLAEYVYSRNHDLLVAFDDTRPVGFVLAVYDIPDEVTLAPQAFIAYMAVEPAEQRRGIGSRLIAEVDRAARERGLPYVSLMVTEGNAPAFGLYERSGFLTERRMLTKRL